jgi:PPM family protein phosphatase
VSDLDVGQATDVGHVREANEDALLVARGQGPRIGEMLVAVADGMGGHQAGEVASALAVESLARTFDEAAPGNAAGEWIRSAVELANGLIWRAAREDVDKEGMGTTLVAALLNADGDAVIANVGDSRAYSVVDDEATLVTVDHTWVNEQVLAGALSERQARLSPFRNLLTRALGTAPSVEVDVFRDVRLGVGDALVLVSDGVTGYLDEGDVGAAVREAGSAQEAAERLVREALARGGADNATAVVVRRR